jgi:hypothetical protein
MKPGRPAGLDPLNRVLLGLFLLCAALLGLEMFNHPRGPADPRLQTVPAVAPAPPKPAGPPPSAAPLRVPTPHEFGGVG